MTNFDKIPELKPCPFCGGKAKVHNCAFLENETMAMKMGNAYGIHCENCGTATIPKNSIEEVIEMWNERTYDD